jgi:NAD(P)-dependent dehydrogenase (short-subunit alcohol dehydrogenase family)
MMLKGKHALVTGSSRGIGRGIALKLAERGARVAVHYYRNEDAAKATLAKIREYGSDGFVVQADVCHPEEISRIFKQVEMEFASLDIFVSNARTRPRLFINRPWRSRWRSGTPPWIRKPRHSWLASARRRD